MNQGDLLLVRQVRLHVDQVDIANDVETFQPGQVQGIGPLNFGEQGTHLACGDGITDELCGQRTEAVGSHRDGEGS